MTRRTAADWDQWLAEVSRGQNPEAWRGIMCFLRWLQIRAQEGHPVPNFMAALEGDILHVEQELRLHRAQRARDR